MATSESGAPQQDLTAAITRHRDELVHFVRARAGGLLRFEGATDLVSGLVVELLSRAPDFEARGPEADRAWLFEAARLHLGNRRRYWGALKRETSRLLRTGLQGGSQTGQESGAQNPIEVFAASQTGPVTFAFRTPRPPREPVPGRRPGRGLGARLDQLAGAPQQHAAAGPRPDRSGHLGGLRRRGLRLALTALARIGS